MPFKCRLVSSTIEVAWIAGNLALGESLLEIVKKNKNKVKMITFNGIPQHQIAALLVILEESAKYLTEIELNQKVVQSLREDFISMEFPDEKSIDNHYLNQLILKKIKPFTAVEIDNFMQESSTPFIKGGIRDQKAKDKIIQSIKADKNISEQLRSAFKTKTLLVRDFYYDSVTNKVALRPFSNSKLLKVDLRYASDFFIDNYFLRFVDPYFKLRSNRISGTNYVATADVPVEDIQAFFKEMVFNPHIEGGIRTIICMNDYSVWRHYKSFNSGFKFFKTINVEITFAGTLDDKPAVSDTERDTPFQLTFNLTEKSTNLSRSLNVYVIPTADNDNIDLENDLVKETILKVYLRSKKERIASQCAAGVGRSNSVLLTYLFLDHFESIFRAKTLELACQKIHEQMQLLQEYVPAAVMTKRQFKGVLKNALILHDYAIRNEIDLSPEKEQKSQDDNFRQLLEDVNGFCKYEPSENKVIFKSDIDARNFLAGFSIQAKIKSVKSIIGAIACAYIELNEVQKNLILAAKQPFKRTCHVL